MEPARGTLVKQILFHSKSHRHVPPTPSATGGAQAPLSFLRHTVLPVLAAFSDFPHDTGSISVEVLKRHNGSTPQYPGTNGEIFDYSDFVRNAHAKGVKVFVAIDLLALTMLKPPREFGADMAIGSAQRFGVPTSKPTVKTYLYIDMAILLQIKTNLVVKPSSQI